MLRQLSIRNVALIEALDLEFAPGFTVLTGETGAGKSIVIESLALALGGRADSELVRQGAERCTVVAEFERLPSSACALLEELGISADECIVKRQVGAEGRSRAFINGEPVPVNALRRLGELLADIHGQHAHHALLRRQVQRELLDAHAGSAALLERLAGACAELARIRAERDEIGGDPAALEAEVERLQYELEEFEQDDFSPAALERLEQEQRRLAGMSELIAGVDSALAQVSDGEPAAQDLLAESVRLLADLEELEPDLLDARRLLDEALINIGEAARSLHGLQSGLEADPAALASMESRLGRVHALARKHRCEPQLLQEVADALRERLERLSNADGRRRELTAAEQRALAQYRTAADELHALRAAAAQTFGAEVTAALAPLGLKGAQFRVAVTADPEAPPSPSGYDDVEFLFSGNAGMAPRPLSKVASGGELSRASLAIEMAALGRSTLPTIVFDEVDVGIGGRVASIIGQKLRELGEQTQVLCITHLAQVAAQGHQHYCVSKAEGSASVHVRALDRTDRTEEVARMLGGLEITASTRAHAEELIGGP